MPTPSRTTPNTSTPPRLTQSSGQSNLDGFVRLTRPLMEPNDHDDRKENQNANFTPLQRRRRILDNDDDDDVPMVNRSQPPDVIHIVDTENESDANFAVILQPQHQTSHDQLADRTKSRRTQSPAPAELSVTKKPVCFRYQN